MGKGWGVRKDLSAMAVGKDIAMLIVALVVVNELIDALGNIVNYSDTADRFYIVYQILGLATGETGLLSIGMLLLGVAIIFNKVFAKS